MTPPTDQSRRIEMAKKIMEAEGGLCPDGKEVDNCTYCKNKVVELVAILAAHDALVEKRAKKEAIRAIAKHCSDNIKRPSKNQYEVGRNDGYKLVIDECVSQSNKLEAARGEKV